MVDAAIDALRARVPVAHIGMPTTQEKEWRALHPARPA